MRTKRLFLIQGFTLVEILVSVLIFSIMAGGFFIILSTGQTTWHTTDVSVQLQQGLRQAMQKVTKELHESGFNSSGVCQVTIQDAAGVNNSDILTFRVPVDWDNDGDVKDIAGNIEWGAPIHWADKNPNCEGTNNNCHYLDYSIQYLIINENHFARRVLDNNGAIVRTDVLADNVTDFQVSRNGNIVSIQITAQRNTVFGRSLTSTSSADVLLRNRG